jgi:hypothetical protein
VSYALAPFDLATAGTLVGITFGVGMLFGVVFALVWNWLARPSAELASRPAAALSTREA